VFPTGRSALLRLPHSIRPRYSEPKASSNDSKYRCRQAAPSQQLRQHVIRGGESVPPPIRARPGMRFGCPRFAMGPERYGPGGLDQRCVTAQLCMYDQGRASRCGRLLCCRDAFLRPKQNARRVTPFRELISARRTLRHVIRERCTPYLVVASRTGTGPP
jgi:hypothetical protein